MSDPMRISIPDGEARTPRNQRCPGAYLVVDRAEYFTLQRDGLVWSTGQADIPHEGKASSRVFCTGDVETMVRPHGTYQTGLCHSCGVMEANQRRDLRDRAAPMAPRGHR